MQSKILVSACLMGQAVRYDGRAKPLLHPVIETWRAEGRLVTICPEISAGTTVPRPPAEIAEAATGEEVLAGTARVVELTGADVTEEFLQAAKNAVALARRPATVMRCIDGSPSCRPFSSRNAKDGEGSSGLTGCPHRRLTPRVVV